MIKAIITDIEGTTTSVSFVYDVLFPYFLNNINKLLVLKSVNKEVKNSFETIKKENGIQLDDNQVIELLKKWVAEDIKDPNLKLLQGIIWEDAYKKGEIKGHLYNDVLPALKFWKNELHLSLYIYSSGSVNAQKLLFGYSEEGDITSYFTNYFDTKVGHKRESISYKNIAENINCKPPEILFLSDIEEELDAAKKVGYNTLQLVREDTKPSKKHLNVKDFNQISIDI